MAKIIKKILKIVALLVAFSLAFLALNVASAYLAVFFIALGWK